MHRVVGTIERLAPGARCCDWRFAHSRAPAKLRTSRPGRDCVPSAGPAASTYDREAHGIETMDDADHADETLRESESGFASIRVNCEIRGASLSV